MTFIWHKDANIDNQYVDFLHCFHLEKIDDNAEILISADSDYALYINDEFVDCGQFHDYPNDKHFDTIKVSGFLRKGENKLNICCYHKGTNTLQYISVPPKLLYCLTNGNEKFESSEKTLCRLNSSYNHNNLPMITTQLGYTYKYDAGAKAFEWQNSILVAYNGKLSERPIKKTVIHKDIQSKIIAQGYYIRRGEFSSIAESMYNDYLSTKRFDKLFGNQIKIFPNCEGLHFDKPSDTDGIYLVIDLNKESCGFFTLDIEASKGTIIDIAHGEHLTDLRVRSKIGYRNFADAYICKDGRQSFTHYLRRIAARYIQVHINGAATLYNISLKPCHYPVRLFSEFKSTDSLHNKIADVCIDTLLLCMHEHFEDSPWREQALYAADSRNEALCGYYCFGEYEFAKASVDLLGKGLREDGFLNLCAPTNFSKTIPCFSMLWIVEAAEYILFSGDTKSAYGYMETTKKMFSIYIKSIKDDLLAIPKGNDIWNFYEWSYAMSGGTDYNKVCNGVNTIEAPYQMFFYIALERALWLAGITNDKEFYDTYTIIKGNLKKAINKNFWNKGRKLYCTYLVDGEKKHYSELVQALAIYSGICEDIEPLLDKIIEDKDLVPSTLSHSIFKFDALMMGNKRHQDYVFDNISEIWGSMLYKGATTFWETIKGDSDFDMAASLCHGWSAIPIYLYYRYSLGIYPKTPGFIEYTKNQKGNLKSKGKIFTPSGEITI